MSDGSALSQHWLRRMGSVALVVGAVAGMVGNLVHPATPIGDAEGVAHGIAESGTWFPIHLVIVFGIILMLGGLVAIADTITGGLAGALVRLGLFAAVAGAAVGLVLVTLDGVAAKQLADQWATAPPEEAAVALRIVSANETINYALASLFNILFAGVTFILYGLAVAFSDVYPRWSGWIVAGAGVGSIGAGLVQAFYGEPTSFARILTIIGPTVITLWLLAMGIRLARSGTPEPSR